jgi:plasmid stabilization system protein ParE
MAEYRLSVRARSQLIDIFEFTAMTFGAYQAEAYHAGLERTSGLLADFPRIGHQVDELGTVVFASSRTTSFTRKRTRTSSSARFIITPRTSGRNFSTKMAARKRTRHHA